MTPIPLSIHVFHSLYPCEYLDCFLFRFPLFEFLFVVFEGFHGEDTCERGLRLHHVFFLERVMVALKRAHSFSMFRRRLVQTYRNVEHEWALFRATITLSRKNTWCNRKPLSHFYLYLVSYCMFMYAYNIQSFFSYMEIILLYFFSFKKYNQSTCDLTVLLVKILLVKFGIHSVV